MTGAWAFCMDHPAGSATGQWLLGSAWMKWESDKGEAKMLWRRTNDPAMAAVVCRNSWRLTVAQRGAFGSINDISPTCIR